MAPGALAVFGFELVVDFVEDLLEAGFPAFEFGFGGGHFRQDEQDFQDLHDGANSREPFLAGKQETQENMFVEKAILTGWNSRENHGGKTETGFHPVFLCFLFSCWGSI